MATSDGGDYKQTISADPTGFIAAWKQATGAAQSSADAIKGSVSKLGDAFGDLLGPLKAVAGVLAGGAFFKEAIDATKQLTGEQIGLAKALGITGTEASTLNTALHDIGSDSDTYITAFQKFARQLKNNEDGLKAMGLQTRDANGNLRDSNTLFKEALADVGNYKPGLDQTTAAMTYFGKSVNEVMTLQKLNSTVLDDAKKKNADLFLNLTQEGVESTKKYKLAMAGVGDVFLGIKKVIAEAMMPILTQLATWFNDIGPTAVFVFKVAIDVLATAVHAVLFVFKALWDVLRALADPLFVFGSAIKKLILGDFAGAAADLQTLGDSWAGKIAGVFQTIKDDAIATGAAIANVWTAGTEATPAGKGTKTMGDFKKTNGGQAEKSQMGDWETALAERKAAIEREGLQEGQLREMSKQAEAEYWRALSMLSTASLEDRQRAAKKMYEAEQAGIKQRFEVQVAALQAEQTAFKNNTDKRLEFERAIQAKFQEGTKGYEESQKRIVEIQRQAAEQEKQINESRVAADTEARLAVIALEEQTVQTAVQLGIVSRTQELAALSDFEQRRKEIALAGLNERLRIAELDPDRNRVLIDKIYREMEALQLAHEGRMGAIRGQQVQNSLQPVLDTMSTIQGSWSNLLQQVASGSLSLGGFIKGLFVSVGQAVIGTLSNMAAEWAAKAILSKIISKATAASEIIANAGVAGAAATASAAAIPFYGWAMAPEAGAAAFAAAMSYLPSVSAAGGFDIGANVNPIIQAHAREMVLPAKHADVIRNIADGGGGRGGDVNVSIKAHPMPGNYFMVHQDQLVAAMKSAHRNFKF